MMRTTAKKHLRRFAVLLLSVLLLTGSVMPCPAKYGESGREPVFEYVNNFCEGRSVLVVTFDMTCEPNPDRAPQAQLVSPDGTGITDVAADDLLLTEYTVQSAMKPPYHTQLFIRLPKLMQDMPEDTLVLIPAGVCRNTDNEDSAALSQPLCGFEHVRYYAGAYFSKATLDSIYPIAGRSMEPKVNYYGSDYWLWTPHTTCLLDGEPVTQAAFPAPKSGTHTLRMQLNDFIYDEMPFTTVSPVRAYFYNLGVALYEAVQTPKTFLETLKTSFAPGMGLLNLVALGLPVTVLFGVILAFAGLANHETHLYSEHYYTTSSYAPASAHVADASFSLPVSAGVQSSLGMASV